MQRATRDVGGSGRLPGRRRAGPSATLFLLALAAGALACSPGAPEPEVVLGGTRLERVPALGSLEGLDPAAVELVRRAAAELEAELASGPRWTQLGLVLHAHGRLELARTCYEQRLLRAPTDARTWYWLALVEEELGAPERALERLEQCLRHEPGYPPAHWRLGLLWLASGDLARAESALQAALDLAPHDAAAVVGLARVRLQQGDFADAAARLEQHLRRLPGDAHARFLLGTAYRSLGRAEEAERTLAGVAGGEPLRVDPWQAEMQSQRQGYRTDFLRAVDLLARGERAQAIALLEDLHARQPEDTLVHVNLHRAYRLNGELDRALELLLEARRVDPLMDVVHLHLAGAYRDKAHTTQGAPQRVLLEAALASSETACELGPNRADAHGMRGDVLADLGRTEEALAAHVRAAELDPDSPMWQERAGIGLCKAGRWAEAVPRLRRLDLLQPRSARTLYHLGAALANSGALEEARVPLEQARFLDPEDAAIRTALENLELSRLGGGPGR